MSSTCDFAFILFILEKRCPLSVRLSLENGAKSTNCLSKVQVIFSGSSHGNCVKLVDSTLYLRYGLVVEIRYKKYHIFLSDGCVRTPRPCVIFKVFSSSPKAFVLVKIFEHWFITTFGVDYQDKNAWINLFPLLAIMPYPMPLWNASITNSVKIVENQLLLGVSSNSIYKILHGHLALKKICFRWLPHNLTISDFSYESAWKRHLLRGEFGTIAFSEDFKSSWIKTVYIDSFLKLFEKLK